jgi:hypothetical protein
MTNRRQEQNRIPDFASREQAAAWFDAHDVADYLDEFEIVDKKQVQVAKNLSANITVRLTPELLNQLKGQAQQVGVGPSTLARMWILERLREVNRPRVGSE